MNRVALTNLGKYNEGIFLYTWLYLPYTEKELEETMKKIQVGKGFYNELGCPYEEWFISDHEFEYDFIRFNKNLEDLNEIIWLVDSLDEVEVADLRVLLHSDYSADLKEMVELIRSGDYSVWSFEDFVEEIISEMTALEEEQFVRFYKWLNEDDRKRMVRLYYIDDDNRRKNVVIHGKAYVVERRDKE